MATFEAYLTLEKVIDMCRSSETTAAQMKTLTATQEASPTLDVAIQSEVITGRKAPVISAGTSVGGTCGTGHIRQQSCPAIGTECLKYGR